MASVDAEKASLDRVLEQLRLQVSDLQTRCSLQQDDSRVQQELLCNLQSQLKERTTEVEQLQPTVTELNTCKAERSLSEMAAVVGSNKLEADDLRESHSALQEAQWTADSLVPNCSQCHVAFSVSRRRSQFFPIYSFSQLPVSSTIVAIAVSYSVTSAPPKQWRFQAQPSQCVSAIGVTICYFIDTQPNLKAATSWRLSHPLRYEPVI
ncbi:hypothetical protein PHET_11081 [Paragonimus heterotremus]|uniref:Uncharacterized protein n=1 Tax=Paragonimus heterotremus TaxID=100268 RepID=A0A8J4T108_9TREM|nr:hypothetical protein PHET_11081 [Paragonimus heterotremus]